MRQIDGDALLLQVDEQRFQRLDALRVDLRRVVTLRLREGECLPFGALRREDRLMLGRPEDGSARQEGVEGFELPLVGRVRALGGVEPTHRVVAQVAQRQLVLPVHHRQRLDRVVGAQTQPLGHRPVVGNAWQPQEVGACGDRREKLVADRDDHCLGQAIVPHEHLGHREHVLVIVAMDMGVVEAAIVDDLGMRLLPVAGAEHYGVRRLVHACDVGVTKVPDVEIEIEHRVVAAIVEGACDLLGRRAIVERGGEGDVGVPQARDAGGHQNGSELEVAGTGAFLARCEGHRNLFLYGVDGVARLDRARQGRRIVLRPFVDRSDLDRMVDNVFVARFGDARGAERCCHAVASP